MYFDFLVVLGRIYFTGDYGKQKFLVFVPMLNSRSLDNNKKLVTEYRPEHHLKKLNHLILALN